MTGALIAVVGPSGAGKDAVIDQARADLAHDPRVVFPRRVITRPSGAGEEHLPATEEEFAALAAAGAFSVHWRAHGLRYGVPRQVADDVDGGSIALVNVSRAVLAELGDVFPEVHVVRVTVPDDVRRARILSRGREDADAALARLRRADPDPGFPVDLEIVNDGELVDAGRALARFVADVGERVRA